MIHHSKCVMIAFSKDHKTGQNVLPRNPCKDGATHYNDAIFRAMRPGWSREKIGSHAVRNNTIFRFGQPEIQGGPGAVFNVIENNPAHRTLTKRLFSWAEIGGIKIHVPVDVLIRSNPIHCAGSGVRLDRTARGTGATRNHIYDHSSEDLYTKVSDGPYMVEDKLFL